MVRPGAIHSAGPRLHIVVLDPNSAGLAVARRMVGLGARVTMLAGPGRPETRSRGVEAILAPFEPGGESWLAALAELAAAGDEAVLVPATDRASELLARAGGRLPAGLRMFERPESSHLALMDKDTAEGIARRAGVAVPWTARVRDRTELERALATASWPCVVKPMLTHRWRARYGEPYAFFAADGREAAALLERPLRDGVGMLLCQYVPGGDDAVEEAILVRLADGSYPVAFGCRKLRQFPLGFGATALGESSPLREAMAIAERVLEQADFVGVAGVEVKRDVETGRHWFLEVNVRVPAQWGLGDACGVEATPRLIAALRGERLGPQRPLRPGVRIVVPDLDVRACRSALADVPGWRRPALAVRFLRSWRGAGERGLLNRHDPGPGVAWLRLAAARLLGRLRARLRRRPS